MPLLTKVTFEGVSLSLRKETEEGYFLPRSSRLSPCEPTSHKGLYCRWQCSAQEMCVHVPSMFSLVFFSSIALWLVNSSGPRRAWDHQLMYLKGICLFWKCKCGLPQRLTGRKIPGIKGEVSSLEPCPSLDHACWDHSHENHLNSSRSLEWMAHISNEQARLPSLARQIIAHLI